MKTYARIQADFPRPGLSGVVEIITAEQDIRTLYHPALVATLVDVTDHDLMPAQWWTYDGDGFHPPA